jgi:hypothetical protein
MLHLEFLPKLLKEIPPAHAPAKTLFDIAGFPHAENVNSNCLAYYLNEKEDHGLGRLFLDSLVTLAHEDKDWQVGDRFEPLGEYTVHREVATQDRKRIDLYLRSRPAVQDHQDATNIQAAESTEEAINSQSSTADWTIVIENKIYAWLYNDLDNYVRRIETGKSLRIVLSPFQLKTQEERDKMKANGFIHLTHKVWMAKVKAMLHSYTTQFTSLNTFRLEEFINSIDRIYLNLIIETRMETIRQQFRQNQAQVRALLKADAELSKHITQSAIEAMRQFDYEADSAHVTDGKWFRITGNEHQAEHDALRFYLWLDGLRFSDELQCYYELYGKEIKYGPEVHKQLKAQFPDLPSAGDVPVSWGKESKSTSTGGHYHLFYLKLKIEDGDEPLMKRIYTALQLHFFTPRYSEAAFKAYLAAKSEAIT